MIGKFFTFGLSNVVPLFFLVSKMSFFKFFWNDYFFFLTSWIVGFCNNGGRLHPWNWGREHPWNSVGPHPMKLGALCGGYNGACMGCCLLFFGHGLWAQHELPLVMWGLTMFGQQVGHWSQYFLLLF